jgi:glycosyltransferase involved in cell wall biosynthesis
MKILILPDTFLDRGDTVSFAFDQAMMLQSAETQVAVLNFVFSFLKIPSSKKLESFCVINGVGVFSHYTRLPVPVRFLLRKKLLYWLLSKKLSREFARVQSLFGTPDIMHAHNSISGGIIARHISKITKIPYVITEHSSETMANPDGLRKKKVVYDAVIHADSFFCVSNELKSAVDSLNFPIDTYVIGNVIPRKCVAAVRQVQESSAKFSILSVGSLTKNKDVESLIKAFAATNLGNSAILNIIGDGPERQNLEKLAAKLDVKELVVFHGQISRASTYQIMQETSLFCSTSKSETFGVAILEALVMKIPVICTDSGGPRDFIAIEDLIPAGDIEGICKAINEAYAANLFPIKLDDRRDLLIDEYGEVEIGRRLKNFYSSIVKDYLAN